MGPAASYWIEKLSLEKHVEGGFYKRIYCSGITIPAAQLPAIFKGDRPIATSIYFLLEAGEVFQCTIKAGSWFGAILKKGDYVLVGCTVSPGFDFEDFELAKRNVLLETYPQHEPIIKMLTH